MKLRSRFIRILVAVSAAFCTLNTSAQGILDQSFEPVAPNIFAVSFNGNSLGETFTVGLAGSLTRVDVFIARNELQTDGDIAWTLTAVGQSGALASGTVPYSNLSLNYTFQSCLVPVGAVAVNPGDVLAITLNSAHQFAWAGNDNNSYLGGSEVGAPFYDDLGFRTYVAPVPEPSSSVLLLTGAGVFVWRNSRRSSSSVDS